MVMILGASMVLWILFAASQAFKLDISPQDKMIAQIGDSLSLTCNTTGCESPSFSWRTQIDSPLHGRTKIEGSKSVLIMDAVSSENEHSYLCTATCGSQKLEREIQVNVYSFPKDPEVQLSGPLEVGKPVMVKCLVPDVYPSDSLEVELFKGDHLLTTQMFLEAMEKKSLVTKSLEVTFTPGTDDIGKAFVCRARLHIDSVTKERETVEKLQVYISPKNTVISVYPSRRLQEGDAVMMTCSSEGLPAPEIFWSKKLDSGNLQLLSGNATLTLIAMRMEDSGIYVCEGVNLIGRDKAELELVVQDGRIKSQINNGHHLTVYLMFAKSSTFYFICYLSLYHVL
ncbi:Vcam1 [Phodopus roborovskii]|uniref:Vascular cell adhesion protein 1 n=1 Tax=Phodopus roborovskii TaxID=109678 RepID=A0AAU9ZA57_PHORO|nr:Vcam1 [Phodopus roborovskii]